MRLIAGFSALALTVASAHAETVMIKWNGDYAHNNEKTFSKDYTWGWSKNFQNGAPAEHGVVKHDGLLKAEIYKPKTPGPHPFVLLLHGCAGLDENTQKWVVNYTDHFNKLGFGVLVLDSFSTRGVHDVCDNGSDHTMSAHFARRRSEDAYSALNYLVDNNHLGSIENRKPAYLLGRSNGGTTTIMAFQYVNSKFHPNKFAGGFALFPGCKGFLDSRFYAPLYVFIAGQDGSGDPRFCKELAQLTRDAGHPAVKGIVYQGASHGFVDNTKLHKFHGYWIGHHALAAKDTLSTIDDIILERVRPTSGLEIK